MQIGSATWFDGAAAQRANNAVGFLNFAVLTMGSNMAGEFLGAFAIGPLLGRAAPVVANLLGRGGTQESVALFRAVSEAEFEQVLKTGAFEAGPNSLGGKWFAESAADAAKWGDRLQGPGNSRILRTELPKDAADSLMRVERLDSIGPARYGELNQINVPGMKVGGQ